MKDRVCHDELTLADVYGIISNEYKDVMIPAEPFSVRVINACMRGGIITVAALLESTSDQLKNIKGFGKTSLEEVYAYCATLQSTQRPSSNRVLQEPTEIDAQFKEYAEQIALGDFSFFEKANRSNAVSSFVSSLKEAYDVLGEEMVFTCITSPEEISPIILTYVFGA